MKAEVGNYIYAVILKVHNLYTEARGYSRVLFVWCTHYRSRININKNGFIFLYSSCVLIIR